MNSMKITCQQCNKLFDTTQLKLCEDRHSSGLYRVFYQCPHCGKEYFVCYHNDLTHKIQEEIKEAEYYGQNVKAAALKRKLKKEMDKLNNR